jgi:hypothetical protein
MHTVHNYIYKRDTGRYRQIQPFLEKRLSTVRFDFPILDLNLHRIFVTKKLRVKANQMPLLTAII